MRKVETFHSVSLHVFFWYFEDSCHQAILFTDIYLINRLNCKLTQIHSKVPVLYLICC